MKASAKYERRIRQLPDRFDGRDWHYKPQAIIRLGTVGAWSMVRVAEYRDAAPFVISTKKWDRLPIGSDE